MGRPGQSSLVSPLFTLCVREFFLLKTQAWEILILGSPASRVPPRFAAGSDNAILNNRLHAFPQDFFKMRGLSTPLLLSSNVRHLEALFYAAVNTQHLTLRFLGPG